MNTEHITWRNASDLPDSDLTVLCWGAAPAAPADHEVAAWNAEVARAKAEKMERRMKAHDNALRAELAKASQR